MDLSQLSDAELDALIVEQQSAQPETSLSSLSDAELDSMINTQRIKQRESVLSGAPTAEREKTTLGQISNDIRGIPSAISGMIGAIPSGLMALANAPKDAAQVAKDLIKSKVGGLIGTDFFADDSSYEKLRSIEAANRLESTAKGAGKMAFSTAGGIAGGTVGSGVPVVGTLAGGSAGAAAGALTWDQLMQSLGIDPMTSPEEALRGLQRDATQALALGGAVKAAAPVLRAAEATTQAMNRKSIGARASDYGKAADFRTIDTPDGAMTKARADMDYLLDAEKLGASRDPAKLLTKINEATETLGAKVGEAIKSYDSARTEPVRPDFNNALEHLYSGKVPADLLPSYLERLVKIEEGIRREGGGSLEYVQRLKTAIGKSWDPADKVKASFDRAVYRDLQTTIESKAPVVKALNEEISKYRTVEPIVIRALKQSENVSPLSQLRDVVYTTGGIGAPTIAGSVLGGPAGAAAGAGLGLAGKAIASPKGQATIAKAVRKISKAAPANKDVVSMVQALTAAKSDEKKDFARVFKREKGKEMPAKKTEAKASPIDDATLDAVRKVESNNGKNLLSPAGAEGPYQFMPYMAKRVGLKDPYDEVESRKAAKWLLEDEFKALKDIKLALAAYNVGRPAVLAAIKKADSRDFDEVAKYLPEETRNYVPKVLNAKQKVTTA